MISGLPPALCARSWLHEGGSVTKERIEKTLITLDEKEVREALLLARCNDPDEILKFVTLVIAKKVEAALRRRCG